MEKIFSCVLRLCAREALLLFMIRMAHPPFYSQTPQHPCGSLIIICLEVNPKCKCIFLTFLNSVLAGLSALSLQSKWKEERCMWLSVPYQGCRPCLEAPVLGCFTLLKLIILGLALPEWVPGIDFVFHLWTIKKLARYQEGQWLGWVGRNVSYRK